MKEHDKHDTRDIEVTIRESAKRIKVIVSGFWEMGMHRRLEASVFITNLILVFDLLNYLHKSI